jgi:hypothetical protein
MSVAPSISTDRFSTVTAVGTSSAVAAPLPSALLMSPSVGRWRALRSRTRGAFAPVHPRVGPRVPTRVRTGAATGASSGP